MRFLVILILSFILYLVVRLLIGFSYLSSQRRKRQEQLGGEMVKDPICDTYVPKSRAIEKNVNGQTIYFCSQECIDAFFKKRRAI
ncbi:MAG: transcriptional regulator [Nitrospirae bacterium]|nr:transcriptional regulator [Nitrospirota bacterium]